MWYCVCDCGAELVVSSNALLTGNRTACGAHRYKSGRAHDLTGQTFGRLTAVAPATRRSSEGDILWYCVCSCGGEKWVRSKHLVDKRVVSCGCRWAECKQENFRQALAVRHMNHHGPWAGLFGKPYIRPRKARKVDLLHIPNKDED